MRKISLSAHKHLQADKPVGDKSSRQKILPAQLPKKHGFDYRFALIVVLLVALIVVVAIPMLPEKPSVIDKVYDVHDECGVIANQVMHTVDSDSSCRSQCRALCDSFKKEFVASVFTPASKGCHKCSCTCRGQ